MASLNDLYSTKLGDISSAEMLCDIARPLIQAKAKRLVRRPGFVPADQEDIEQDVFLRLVSRFSAGPAGSWPVLAFINRIVNQSIANQIRDRTAEKRDSRSVRSLNVSAGNDRQRRELGDSVTQAHLDARVGRLSPQALHQVELGMDLEETLAEFSPGNRELCEKLQVDSVCELARRLSMPRATLTDWVRKLRRVLKDRGLNEYRQ